MCLEEREDGLRIVVFHVGLIERIEEFRLLFIQERNRIKRSVGIFGKRRNGIANRLRERLHHLATVTTIVILNVNSRFALNFEYIEGDFEFRHIKFHGLRQECFAFDLIFRDDS